MKCQCCFWIFNSKFQLATQLVFGFADTIIDAEMSIKRISVKYAEFITSLSILKGTEF